MAKKVKNIEEIIQANPADGIVIKINKEKKLSKLEIEFNKQTEKIQELKNQLEILPKQAQDLQARFDKELSPLEKEVVEKRILYVKNLEHAYNFMGLAKVDREEALELILGELIDLINEHNREELIPMYDQYNEMSYEEEKKEMQEEQKTQMEMAYNFFNGSMFGKGEKKSFEGMSMQEMMEEMIKEQAAEEEKQKQAQWEKQEKQKNKKKTNRQMEAEQKKQAEEQLFTKSTRPIYTELAKELHPDREQDEQKREWKTEIMKKVTSAYQNNDLYELLRLQLEYQQAKFQLQDMPEDILGFYVKVLKNQVSELNRQLQGLTRRFHEKIVNLGLGKSNQSVAQRFRREKEQLSEQINTLEHTNRSFKDKKYVKEYLKQSRNKPQMGFDFGSIFDMFK